MSIDPKQIESIVRQVLSEPEVAACFFVSSASNDAELTKKQAATSCTSSLREQNLARWLGHMPTRRGGRAGDGIVAGDEKFHLPPLPSGREKEDEYRAKTLEEDKNLIPNPRKPEKLEASLEHTPARIGVWRAGTRYLTKVALKLRADHAVAKDAVYAELKPEFAAQNGWTLLTTKATSKEEFLLRPDLGRQLDDASLKTVLEKGIKNPDIQITVADGLSAWAAERYAPPMVKELTKLCQQQGYTVGTVFCVKYSRIAIQDVIGEAVNAKISIILLGERPGLGTGDSLSNYMVYGPKVGIVNAKKSMISNIHPAGHTPEEAAKITVYMFQKMFEQKCSGVELRV